MSLEKILLGRHYIAIEIFSIDNADAYSVLEAEQKRKEIVISKSDILNNIAQVQQYKSNSPCILIINNKQVLQKEVKSKESNDLKLLHNAFPNLKLEDFYYEIWRRENSSIIAICRKSYVNDLCQMFQENFTLAGISLGICSITSIKEFVTPEILTTNTQIINNNSSDNLLSFNSTNRIQQYDINGLIIPNTHLLGFCGILKSILRLNYTTGSINELEFNLLENYKQKTFFQKGLLAGIGIILFALLLNFLLFSHYFEKSKQLAETISLSSGHAEIVNKIKQRIKDKEQKLSSFIASNQSKSSLVINDIVKILPASILLSEIDYHPLEKKIKNKEAVISQDNLIIVSGTVVNNEAFTEWIREIEKQNWVENVMIIAFGKNENNTVFKIRITLK